MVKMLELNKSIMKFPLLIATATLIEKPCDECELRRRGSCASCVFASLINNKCYGFQGLSID